jgi:hypothetical protein
VYESRSDKSPPEGSYQRQLDTASYTRPTSFYLENLSGKSPPEGHIDCMSESEGS